MFTERTSVGLDVHARSVVAAAIDTVTGATKTARLVPSHEVVLVWVHALPGPVAVTYEAGPTGYGLARAFAKAETRCVVAAPSKIVRPAGDRVKTDAKDAMLLARLLRMDEITAVRVPTVGEEAARDLVRAREDARIDLMAARHRLSKLLLRHGHPTAAATRGDLTTSGGCVASGSTSSAPKPRSTPALRTCTSPPPAGLSWTGRSRPWPPTASSPPS